MANEPNEFDIEAADELQRRHGWSAENWKPSDVNPANVPEQLRYLIPLARRWGVTCDVTRHDAGSHATDLDLTEIRDQLHGTHAFYEDWAFGAVTGFDPTSSECYVFGAMYRFEAEECHGPGINSKLDWAIRRFKDSPDVTNRQRLQSALDWVIARGRRFIKPRQASIEVAENLLLKSERTPLPNSDNQ